MVEVVGHLQHRLHESLRQQPGHDGCGPHHQQAAQQDGGERIVIDGPDRFRILSDAQDLTRGQQGSVVIGLVPGGLRVAAVAAFALLHGLLDLRAGQVVFHRAVCGRFKQHIACRIDEGDAEIPRNIAAQRGGVLGLRVPGGYKAGLVLQCRPGLGAERLVEDKDAEGRRAHQPSKAHQKEPIADFFFHAARFHSSGSSSPSASL